MFALSSLYIVNSFVAGSNEMKDGSAEAGDIAAE
jgi:hypothetical protein